MQCKIALSDRPVIIQSRTLGHATIREEFHVYRWQTSANGLTRGQALQYNKLGTGFQPRFCPWALLRVTMSIFPDSMVPRKEVSHVVDEAVASCPIEPQSAQLVLELQPHCTLRAVAVNV